MAEYATPPRTGPRPCRSCGRKLHHPIWRRVDHDEYETLCDVCAFRADAEFTEDAAIKQARGIVLFRGAELSGRVVLDRGAA